MSVQVKGSGTIGGLDEGLVVSGIVTASTQINVGSNIKVGSAGVVTATTFSGSGASLTNLPAANLTGALPAISGANLTSLPAQATIANNSDNRVITGGSGVNLNGEANLTFSGSQLSVTGNISLPDSTAPDYVGNIYVGNNSDLKIFHNGSDNFIRSGAGNAKIRIDNNSGVLGARFIPAGAAELYHNGTKMCETSTNGLAFPSGKGIDFSATGNISGTSSELLDDYEEGSWTPTILGWDTFTHYSGSSYYAGWYVKVGGMVHCGWKIYYQNLSTPSSNAHIRISGLPYAAKTISAGPNCHIRFDIPDFSFSGYPVPYLAGNETTIGFYKQVSGSNHISAINATSNYSNNWTMGTATYATN